MIAVPPAAHRAKELVVKVTEEEGLGILPGSLDDFLHLGCLMLLLGWLISSWSLMEFQLEGVWDEPGMCGKVCNVSDWVARLSLRKMFALYVCVAQKL